MKLKDAIIYAIGKAEGLKEGEKASIVELNEVNKYFMPGYRIFYIKNHDDKVINLYLSMNGKVLSIIKLYIGMLDRDQIAPLIITAYQMHVKKCKNKKE